MQNYYGIRVCVWMCVSVTERGWTQVRENLEHPALLLSTSFAGDTSFTEPFAYLCARMASHVAPRILMSLHAFPQHWVYMHALSSPVSHES